MLILTDGASADLAGWALVLEVFDGNSDEAVTAARARWKAYKVAGHDLTYWKQDAQGRWEKAG